LNFHQDGDDGATDTDDAEDGQQRHVGVLRSVPTGIFIKKLFITYSLLKIT
jgi:hypothetical protein